MSSRPKVLSPTTTATNHVPTPQPLRAKASLSSVAKIRRAPSPRPSPPVPSPGSVVNTPLRANQLPLRRPASSQGRPLLLSPITGPGTQDTGTGNGKAYHSSPVSPTFQSFQRQRTASQSTTLVSPSSSAQIKVKAKVSSLAKPQPAPSSPVGTVGTVGTPPARGLHTRSNSIVGLRALPSPHPPPPVPALPPAPPAPPIVNTFPPTPTKSLDPVPNSPRSSAVSSHSQSSSASVESGSGYGSITALTRPRLEPLSQSPEEFDDPISRNGTTPVPLYTPLRQQNGFLSSPPFLSPKDDSEPNGPASPTHERRGSTMTEEEVEQRAEARTNRKIADLEIQTTSLQQLTASLERERHKQSLEIRDLRRKLRESRLALPPRTFQSLKATWEADGLDLEDEEEGEEEEEGATEDPAWKRVKGLVHDMLNLGRRAVDEGHEFLEKRNKSGGGVVRVLTAGEVEELQQQDGGPDSEEDVDADKGTVVQESETVGTQEEDHHELPG
ncbi:hypothetical protein CALVIDRAFT_539343 [Calocera viscosa TUFC12733]|uniref:Uncharacterized protein n=1 Tax=Calocera viscosa (strain TUFC12733) TaxID=1330018 RepID=A0A167JW07_CALVF|nr:hypothetical protein CALVIDRAFT_539343 [Calocera viscosa TUFC12733]